MSGYENELYGKIAESVHSICNNPAIYFSETDIHVLMMQALMEIKYLKKLYDTGCTTGLNQKKEKSRIKYQTMLVHREYGHRDYPNATSDIVIFDKDDVGFIDHPINLKRDKGEEYLVPKYIFEFGTEKISGPIRLLDDKDWDELWTEKICGGQGKKYTDHIANDLQKLSKCKIGGRGFLIHIHRNYVPSRKNTSTIIRYQNEFKNVWEAWKKKTEVKMLVFFVEIGVPTRRITSKIKMFNPHPSVNSGNWEEVSLDKIEKIIKKFLKEETPVLVEIIDSVNRK